MGSDSLVKESSPQGCFWRNLKWALGAITSLVLVGRIVVVPNLKPKAPQVKKVESPTPTPVIQRPASTSPEYDPYFVSLAKTFQVSSDYDIAPALRKKGFRVTKDQAIKHLKDKSMSSATQSFLDSHTDWFYADWKPLGVEQVPLVYATTVKKQPEGKVVFPKHDELMRMVDGMPNHEFFLEIANVIGAARKVSGSEKYFFMYDEASWKKDGLTATKFMGFLEFFTGRAFHGAFFKDLLPFKQTDMHPLMPLEDDLDDSVKQSFALMPRIKVPKALKDKCHSAAGNNITVNLDRPIELKVLVLWGKAYMATCYSPICNPFTNQGYSSDQGPRYVVYPEGKSEFFNGKAEWKGEQECASAVDSYIKSRLPGAFKVAETVAKGLGAPWLRVDAFLDDAAPHGAYLHRLRDSSTSLSGWDKHSDRAMAIVARGFEVRSKIINPKVTTITSEDLLKSLGCKVRMGKAVSCQNLKSQGPSGSDVQKPAKDIMHQKSAKSQKAPNKESNPSEEAP
jgi:hypothetical protein